MPTLKLEKRIIAAAEVRLIAGLDEAGRGAIAGPVVAAAVILPLDRSGWRRALSEVDDSKRLTAERRERLYDLVIRHAVSYGIGSVDADHIDSMGIVPATKRAMTVALSQLTPEAEFLLIDGRIRLQNVPLPQQSIVCGDSKSLSIAAASIVAKVSRDRHMIRVDGRWPQYGFARHKGYGTRQHFKALTIYGPSPIHRRTFAPLRRKLL